MPFDLGAGLSSMGASIAATAGAASLEAQKAALENQKEILADQLATTRETNLENLRQTGEIANTKLQQQGASQLSLQESTQNITAHQTEAKSDAALLLSQIPLQAKAKQDAINAVASDPNNMKNIRAIALANDPTAPARIAEALSTAASNELTLQMNKQQENAKNALVAAEKGGNPDEINAAKNTIAALNYDPGLMAKNLEVANATARLAETAMVRENATLGMLQGKSNANLPDGKAQIAAQQTIVNGLTDSYRYLLNRAIQLQQSSTGGATTPANAPPLSSIFTDGGLAPVTGTPAPTSSFSISPNQPTQSLTGK